MAKIAALVILLVLGCGRADDVIQSAVILAETSTHQSSEASTAPVPVDVSTSQASAVVDAASVEVQPQQEITLKAIVTTNTTRYGRWQTANNVPYYFDPTFPETDRTMVRNAMQAITNDVACIKFVELPATSTAAQLPVEFLYIRNKDATGKTFPTCVTFPGRLLASVISQQPAVNGQARKGQTLGLVGGIHGCLTNVRDTMKILVNALGLRDEFRRANRNQFITVNTAAIDPSLTGSPNNLGAFLDPYPSSADVFPAITAFTNIDLTSITMPRQDRFVTSGQLYTYNAIVGTTTPQAPPAGFTFQPRLSQRDCLALVALYINSGCPATTQCADPFGGVVASPASTVAPLSAVPVVGVPGTVIGGTPTSGGGTIPGTGGVAEPN